jgi:hypothetical protein
MLAKFLLGHDTHQDSAEGYIIGVADETQRLFKYYNNPNASLQYNDITYSVTH